MNEPLIVGERGIGRNRAVCRKPERPYQPPDAVLYEGRSVCQRSICGYDGKRHDDEPGDAELAGKESGSMSGVVSLFTLGAGLHRDEWRKACAWRDGEDGSQNTGGGCSFNKSRLWDKRF